ncbi:MAG: DUF3231 family protein [Tuberibacillus sp.]
MSMPRKNNIRLDSAELSGLWANYSADSMAKVILSYFLKNCDDPETKDLLEYAMTLSDKHLIFISKLYKAEGMPLAIAFDDHDVNPDAPRLFSDIFYLYYLENMTTMGLDTYSAFLSGSSRADIRKYVSECLTTTMDLYNRITELLLEKGLEIRPPYIVYPTENRFVKSDQFLAGWWGEQRPLTAAEIANLFVNFHASETTRALFIGFAQTTQTDELREFFKRGKAITEKHMEVFSGFLKESDLPAPVTWTNEVIGSTTWTFSDRLMMYQMALLGERSLTNFGVSIALSQRRDLSLCYIRLSGEMVKYLNKAAKIMIENHWMEMPPMAVDVKNINSY